MKPMEDYMVEHAPVLWFTGLSGAGKTTIAKEVQSNLLRQNVKAELLDGDEVRETLSSDLGFSKQDRDLQVNRIAFVANLLAKNGIVVLVSAISPYRDSRESAINSFARGFEIFVDAPLPVLEQRDTKGLYSRARLGEIKNLTGVDDPYEKPEFPALHLNTDGVQLFESVGEVLNLLIKECAVARG
ncbi:MAG: adenylyl-sulfate kinase [Actinomycetota bacterium]|nr:MAG: adenylyl-sulfate kinase [Actinomycetota bacterium]